MKWAKLPFGEDDEDREPHSPPRIVIHNSAEYFQAKKEQDREIEPVQTQIVAEPRILVDHSAVYHGDNEQHCDQEWWYDQIGGRNDSTDD